MLRLAPQALKPALLRTVLVAVALVLSATAARAEDPPLHERIDQLIESTAPGLVAPPASDADFLRRVYLDLNGTIPDAATARAFLDDPAPAKRTALVDRLLARPQFARHMQRVFDVMLMERRPQKALPAADYNVTAAAWQEYLRQSFADNKPLDQLIREILASDGAEPAPRAAVKFYLDRDCDANLVTRDVGRLFFGRDMQCAQCHDHPLIDDYKQADYYGLMAFVSRGVAFANDKEKKAYYAERAEGEVNYKSVFTGDARDQVVPQLFGTAILDEPVLGKDEQYVVAPAKDVRPVPKYSRRAQLAALAAGGANADFNRNLANRLWAHMLGRGVVHPLDVEHSANPGVQSELRELLTAELVRMKFDLRAFLRTVALTRAYQRSSEPPQNAQWNVDPGALSPTLAAWKAEADRLAGELPVLETASGAADVELAAAYEKFAAAATARETADKARAEAKKASDEVSAALAAAIKEVGAKEEVSKLLAEALDKAAAAVAKLPDDKPLVDAAGQFKTRSTEVEAQLAAARKLVSEKTPQLQAASLRLAETDKTLEAAVAQRSLARAALDAADAKARESRRQFRTAQGRGRELELRMTDVQAAINCRTLIATADASQSAAQQATEQLAALKTQMSTTADQAAQSETAATTAAAKAAADRAAANLALDAAIERATVRFTLAPLKSLTPEQLAFATMEAVGQVDAQRAALLPPLQKELEAQTALTPEQRLAEEQRLLEARIDEKLAGNIGPFVSLFGQQPGQAPTFQATVHQALFLANGGLLAGWLNPGGNNLTDRLAKMNEPAAVADELYLSVLTRRPTADEQASVAAYWQAAQADRAAAAREMVWSLMASAEFRFNH